MSAAGTDQLAAWIVEVMAERLELAASAVELDERFSRYGLDSLGAVALAKAMAERLGRPVSPILVWRFPTPRELAQHLAATGAATDSAAPASPASLASPEPPSPELSASTSDEPIAIVGMACRFPGAASPAALWRLLREGRSAITEVPASRWSAAAWLDEEPATAGRGGSRWGGFLERVDAFDPLFFGISPREAATMDPQQRLLLELAWEALEDAGVLPAQLRGSQTSVTIGAAWVDYARLLYQQGAAAITQHTVTGHHRSILANRLSYALGLHGPSLAVDSACSSALVAVHLACESLARGESAVALAGAVNLNLLPESTHAMVKFGALSPDGRCHTFDARANGYVRGEGAALLVLKRLSRALADGDPIRCVIRGSAVNNDGPSNGLTAPNPVAQEALLRAAYRRAGVAPSEVQYVELHGTGTQLGDPIEASALGAALGAGRPAEQPLVVGSVKTNFGHLEGAAGLAGLCKAALCLQHRQLVPSLHYQEANPHIAMRELGLRVQTETGDWPAMERELVAGVSSFGMGGTNAHVVLAEWPSPPVTSYPFGAASDEELRRQLAAARRAAGGGERLVLAEPAPGAAHRLAVTARSSRELAQGLDDALAGKSGPRVVAGRGEQAPPIVFVYAGQGAQWLGMGRSLLHREPVLRAALARCEAPIRARLGWSLVEELLADGARSRLDAVEVGWPACIALQIALTELWRSWGIEPAAVIGHSGGEIAAAYAAGALSLDDALATICAYARHLAQVRGRGAMGLVGMTWEATGAALAARPGAPLYRAIHHGVDATVVAGEPAALADWFAELDGRGVFCRRLPVDVAPHSPLVAHLRESLRRELGGGSERGAVTARPARVPLSSAALGKLMPGERFDAEHWVTNFCEPLAFSPAIDELIAAGHRVFLEISTHPSTLYAIAANLRHAQVAGTTLATLRRDEDERAVMLDTLGALYALGAPVRWSSVLAAAVPQREAEAGALLLPLSARSEAALAAQAAQLAAALEGEGAPSLAAAARTLLLGRTAFEHRAALVASGEDERDDVLAGLRALARGEPAPSLVRGGEAAAAPAKVIFVFPGQGSQWPEMARALCASSPRFRRSLEACARALAPHLDWSLMAVLLGEAASDGGAAAGAALLERVDVVQPVLFAMMVALAAEWRALGVEPAAVIGHSQGEIAAACVAGALSLDDAAAIVARRSRALLPLCGRGGMALVELPAEELAPRLPAALAVAAINGPRSTVISGERGALEQLLAELGAAQVFARAVRVDYASHSPQIDELRQPLTEALAEVQPRRAAIPFLSTVTEAWMEGSELDAAYWFDNLRRPVRFSSVVARLLADGGAARPCFVEVSPHPVLAMAIKDAIAASGSPGVVVGSLRRDDGGPRQLALGAAALFCGGLALDGARWVTPGVRAELPPYAFQRERCWIAAAPAAPAPARPAALFSPWLSSSLHEGVWLCEGVLDAARLPYLRDHLVDERAVVPGAAYPALLLEALAGTRWADLVRCEDVTLHAALELGDEVGEKVGEKDGEHRAAGSGATRVQLALSALAARPRALAFRISSCAPGDERWTLHASGVIAAASASPSQAASASSSASASASPSQAASEAAAGEPGAARRARLEVRGARRLDAAAHQAIMREWGLGYRGGFAGLVELWAAPGEALAVVQREAAEAPGAARLDPRWLDASLQAALALDPQYAAASAAGVVMPTGFGSLTVHRRPLSGIRTWSAARPAAEAGGYDVELFDDEGPLVTVRGLRLRRLPRRPAAVKVLRRSWRRADLAPASAAPSTASTAGRWLLVGGGAAQAALAAHLRQRGAEVITLDDAALAAGSAEEAAALVRDAVGAAGCRGAVHLAALSVSPAGSAEPASTLSGSGEPVSMLSGCAEPVSTLFGCAEPVSMMTASEPVWSSALALAQALLRQSWRDVPRLWLVTRRAQLLEGEAAEPGGLCGAPLYGLARTLAVEQPELRCARVDLGEGEPELGALAALAAELVRGGGGDGGADDDELALRGDARWVAELTAGPVQPAAAPRPIRGDASYLVTGGLGGLGLALARWLVERGARRLVLAGRSAPSAAAVALAAELAGQGAAVVFAAADVAVAVEVERLVRIADSADAPLAGVFHLAGLLDDGLLPQQSAARYRRVMAAKLDGAWHLHRLTRRLPLDHFVLYSSVAALLGSPGQTNYAAANAFLDALAEHRRAAGLPATSIAWGPFSEVGLAAALEVRGERLHDRGMTSMTPREGDAFVAALLASDERWAGAVKLDVARWLDFYPALGASGYFRALAAARGSAGAASGTRTTAAAWQAKLRALPAPLRLGAVEALVRQQLALVLQCKPEVITPQLAFTALGLESLTGLELRNRLEVETGLRLPATLLWTRGNAAGVARELADRLSERLSEGGAAVPSLGAAPPTAEPPSAPPATGARAPSAPLTTAAEPASRDDAELYAALAAALDEIEST